MMRQHGQCNATTRRTKKLGDTDFQGLGGEKGGNLGLEKTKKLCGVLTSRERRDGEESGNESRGGQKRKMWNKMKIDKESSKP